MNLIFVLVGTLSRFVWALPLKKRTATECKDILQKILESNRSNRVNSKTRMMMKPMFCRSKSKILPKPEKIWVDKGRQLAEEISHFAKKVTSDCIQHIAKPNRRLRNETSPVEGNNFQICSLKQHIRILKICSNSWMCLVAEWIRSKS